MLKRYVKEFCVDASKFQSPEIKNKLERYKKLVEYGYITNYEAILQMIKIIEENKQ